jgi:hypothetical protein
MLQAGGDQGLLAVALLQQVRQCCCCCMQQHGHGCDVCRMCSSSSSSVRLHGAGNAMAKRHRSWVLGRGLPAIGAWVDAVQGVRDF